MAVENISLQSVGWIGAMGVAIGLIPALVTFSMRSRSIIGEQKIAEDNKLEF